jgi:hypothetical protein
MQLATGIVDYRPLFKILEFEGDLKIKFQIKFNFK